MTDENKVLLIVSLVTTICVGTLTLSYGILGINPYSVAINVATIFVGLAMIIGGIMWLFDIFDVYNIIPDIVITKRTNDFHACIKGHPEIWGCGRNYDEAVGSVIRSHREYFNIKIEYPEQD